VVTGLYNGQNFGPQTATFTGVSAQDDAINNAGTNFFDVYALDSLSVESLGNTYTFNGTGFNYYSGGAPYNYSGFANGFNSNVIRFDNTTGAFLATDNTTFSLTTNGAPVTASFDGRGGFSASVTPAVPEPATWAMMILGMAVVGYAMRRSNVKFEARIKHVTASVA